MLIEDRAPDERGTVYGIRAGRCGRGTLELYVINTAPWLTLIEEIRPDLNIAHSSTHDRVTLKAESTQEVVCG